MKNLKNFKIFVTGCAGFIPSFVTEKLLESGAIVTGIDDLSTGSEENMTSFVKSPNFNFIRGDVSDQELIERCIKNTDYVYHAVAKGIGISVSEPLNELNVNVKSTLHILETIKKYNVKRFVYPSSASVYGNSEKIPESEDDATMPTSPYGVSKLAAEKYCLAYHKMFGVPVVCLRYFNTYGPRQRSDSLYGGVVSIFIKNAILNKPLEIYGTGKQTRDFTYINDTVAATIIAFTAKNVEGEVINIGAGKEYKVEELALKVKEISKNKKLQIRKKEKRIIDNIDRRSADIQKAKRLLQYRPETSIDTGLEETFRWYKNNIEK